METDQVGKIINNYIFLCSKQKCSKSCNKKTFSNEPLAFKDTKLLKA